MSSLLPHSARIRSEAQSYLVELSDAVAGLEARLGNSSDFRAAYKAALAADSVLARLASPRCKPRLTAQRTAIRRTLPLFALGQAEMTRLALRQAIELAFWTIYFSDHPVEWAEFQANPSSQSGNPSLPISHMAHREPAFYRAYAKERFVGESSGLASSAVESLTSAYGNLSAAIHPADLTTTRRIRPAIDDLSPPQLAALRKIHREVCASLCIVLSAFSTTRFNTLPPVHRAWFDWLIGPTRAKTVRSGPFGL